MSQRTELVLTGGKSVEVVKYPTAKTYLPEGWYTPADLALLLQYFQQLNQANANALKPIVSLREKP